MLQIGHFWLYLKLFAQLDNRLTTKIPKVDDRLVIKTKNNNNDFSISSTSKVEPYQRRPFGVVITRADIYDL